MKIEQPVVYLVLGAIFGLTLATKFAVGDVQKKLDRCIEQRAKQ